MKRIPKKRNFFSSRKKIKKSVSVTAEEFLLQQRALVLLVDKRKTIKEVARSLKTTAVTIKRFFEEENFIKELKLRIDYVEDIDGDFCLDQSKISLAQLYEAFRVRISNEDLLDIPIKDLHKMIIDTQREFRLDTPGALTSKVGVVGLGGLQDRYNSSLSARMLNKKKHRKKSSRDELGSGEIIDVEAKKEKRSVGGTG